MLTYTLNKIKIENKPTYHLGDYNLDLLKAENHPPTSQFIDFNFANSFFSLITKPTRITTTPATIIDTIFTNITDQSSSVHRIILTNIGDHLPNFHIIKHSNTQENNNTIRKRYFKTENKIKFQEDLSNANWNDVLLEEDAQISYSKLQEIISSTFNKAFPIKISKNNYHNKLPWLTQGLKRAIENKHKLYTRYLRYNNKATETV